MHKTMTQRGKVMALISVLVGASLGAWAQSPLPPPPKPSPPSLDNPLNRNPARRAGLPSDATPPVPDSRDSTTRPTEAAATPFDPARDSPATSPSTVSPTMGTPQIQPPL
jgi:hypothetical protein